MQRDRRLVPVGFRGDGTLLDEYAALIEPHRPISREAEDRNEITPALMDGAAWERDRAAHNAAKDAYFRHRWRPTEHDPVWDWAEQHDIVNMSIRDTYPRS